MAQRALPLLSSKHRHESTMDKDTGASKTAVSLCSLHPLVVPRLWVCRDKEAFTGKAG